MATLADLRARVADDLDRSDLMVQIEQAIRDAVEHYEAERFIFNEAVNTPVALGSGTDSVRLASLPAYFTKIDRIRIDDGGSGLVDLVPRDYAWLMASQDAKATARPTAYCIYADTLLLDSIADRNYAALLDGVKRISTASAASDGSAWFNEGRHLLRARVKAELYAHVIKEIDQAQVMTAVEQRAYRTLKLKLNTRNSGRVRPTEF
ncbi:hypothetical protein [Reyranella sp. CPCC 100927]|uniref:phage adaptor protein n=1 Tax=Reyranella sp. CPCC 100927 TaxID=2599616 RepID=UPI0011B3BE39|nr:hypothetical protein [Reyranella sp. CPCC 100927]TWT11710.1 hypothetical protein FQU96_14645 [Reyranella sp. CPCC 100927]